MPQLDMATSLGSCIRNVCIENTIRGRIKTREAKYLTSRHDNIKSQAAHETSYLTSQKGRGKITSRRCQSTHQRKVFALLARVAINITIPERSQFCFFWVLFVFGHQYCNYRTLK